MIDIKLSDGNLELFLSKFETYDLLKFRLMKLLDCNQDQVIDRTMEDFTIELTGSPDVYMSFDGAKIDEIFEGYKELMEFDEEDQDIILSYLDLNGYNISLGKSAMYEALDEYFGEFESDREAAYSVLTECLDMTRTQASYVLDTLECVDKVVENSLVNYGSRYYLI